MDARAVSDEIALKKKPQREDEKKKQKFLAAFLLMGAPLLTEIYMPVA